MALWLWLATASAADVDPFQPAGGYTQARGTPQGEEVGVGPLGVAVGVSTSFAEGLTPAGSDGVAVEAVMPVTIQGAWATSDNVRLDLSLPTYAFVAAPVNDFHRAALGDMRLQVLLPVADRTDAAQFGVAPSLTAPTGTGPALTRTGTSAGLTLLASGRSGALGWLFNAGLTGAAADQVEGRGVGSTGTLLAGLWGQATDALRAGVELDFAHGLVLGPEGANRAGSLHLFAQDRLPSGVALGLLAGTGWLRGVGAPDYRLGATLSWAPTERPPTPVAALDTGCDPGEPCGTDTDGDGFDDAQDRCPDAAEDVDGWQDHDGCPEADNDGDGIEDARDGCPMVAGDAARGGCPDQDDDGVPDTRDLCPAMPGPLVTEGCPDRDRDRVPDVRDACPDLPAPPPDGAELSDGCPKRVYVAGDRIVLTEPLAFVPGTAKLQDDARPTLDAVAALLVDEPRLTIVEVAGHTDNRGDPGALRQLSAARAEAVAAALRDGGVAPGRLRTRGYGDAEPIDTNRTSTGRARNARIELRVVQGTGIDRVDRAPDRPVAAPDADPAGEGGRLTVRVQGGMWADVYLDGVRLNKGAPFTDFPVTAGEHRLRVTNAGRGIDWSDTIVVTNGGVITVEVPWSVWE